jgi:hypothetical protein
VTARLAIALAACSATPPVAPPDAPIVERTCTSSFAGNFVETDTSPAVCPSFAGAVLSLSLAPQALDAPNAIEIDLGAEPSSGLYTPETVASWNARAVQQTGVGACLYSAGSDVVPHGSFTLELDATARHGTLSITEYVLPFPNTDCGDGDTELVQISF